MLLESELFGHLRGSFTGATRDRPGLFEVAGKGTILLDEVGDMPPAMQVKLLRILQEGTFRRVGDEAERSCHCRILSASHQSLEGLVEKGCFREDLFYRIQVFKLTVPPLRQRKEDLPLLVQHILKGSEKSLMISAEAMAALLDFDWPGNVRQLENELQRAVILSDTVIEPSVLTIAAARPRKQRRFANLQEELRRCERQIIEEALEEAQGNVTEAAQRLGLHRVALYRKMKNLGLRRPHER
jgi:transcriptional regulator with PAS, ATPase and Fis domain